MDLRVVVARFRRACKRLSPWTVVTIVGLVSWPALGSAIVASAPIESLSQDASKSVWDGVFSDAQATRGQEAYREECAGCHLESLGGADMAPGLVGSAFQTQWNDLSVGDLFERIRISMPQDTPAHLSRQVYVDIVAYILKANSFPSGSSELTPDLAALKQIMIRAKSPQPR